MNSARTMRGATRVLELGTQLIDTKQQSVDWNIACSILTAWNTMAGLGGFMTFVSFFVFLVSDVLGRFVRADTDRAEQPRDRLQRQLVYE